MEKNKKIESISTLVLIFLMTLQALFLPIGLNISYPPSIGSSPIFRNNNIEIIDSTSCIEVERYWRAHFDDPFILISSCDNYNIRVNESFNYTQDYGGFLNYDNEKDIFYANFSKSLIFTADKSNNYTFNIPIQKEGLNENSIIKINIHLEKNKDYTPIYLLIILSPTIIWIIFCMYKKKYLKYNQKF